MKTFTTRAATTFATLALAASGALVAVAPAHATVAPAPAQYDGLSISGLKSAYTLSSSNKTYRFTVNVNGTASDPTSFTDANGDGLVVNYRASGADFSSANVVKVSSRAKDPKAPSVRVQGYTSTLASGANTYELTINSWTTPGVYKLQIPVTQTDWTPSPRVTTTKVLTKTVTVKASAKLSKKATTLSAPSWKNGQTAKLTVRAPEYQVGAKVSLYVKKKGKKKYVKYTTGKLKRTTYSSSSVLLKGKNLRPGDKIYFKVTSVKNAPGYKTSPVLIKKAW